MGGGTGVEVPVLLLPDLPPFVFGAPFEEAVALGFEDGIVRVYM